MITPFEQECNDADELLKLLGLDPEMCRTDGGRINLMKVRALTWGNVPKEPQQPAQAAADARDAALLDALRDNSWDLVCFDMPTGGGDADIGWRVIEHHMAKPTERVVGEAFKDDPRAAIDAALATHQQGSK